MDIKQVGQKSFVFQYTDMEEVEKKRRKLVRLYTFLNRYISMTFSYAEESFLVLALFSNDGILLDLFPRKDFFLKQLHGDGILPSSIWNGIGYNAVSWGLVKKKTLCSIGKENEALPLKKYAVYFSPINMLSIYEPYEPAEQCGLAIIIPADRSCLEYLTMIAGIAHDMKMTLQFNNIATMYYERSGKGLLSIDNMMSKNGEYLATYYNEELFRILGVEPIDMYYKPAAMLIDPMPENKELWSIVNEHRTINNYNMTITVHGKSAECIASTDAFNQPSINAHGVTFYFTTPQKVSAELSKKIANGAVKTFDDIVGNDDRLKIVIQKARRMATTDSNIMILGESGTGKDIFAQAIHNASNRREKPFIALNCSAMPRDLIESELFGYEGGAFTGARKSGNIGKFELANGGTIFLDEIGEMPLDMQSKLLRVVEQKQIMRLSGSRMIDTDVKIIAATNADIWEMIQQKKFRSDLFYRLSTMRLDLPPLRERKADIIPLAKYFILNISKRIGKSGVMRLSPESQKLITELSWYGNVRELQNLMECLVQLYPGDIIQADYIMENIAGYNGSKNQNMNESYGLQNIPVEIQSKRKEPTKENVLEALEICGNNRSEAAKYLGIPRRTLYRKMEKFEIINKIPLCHSVTR
jgi:transcriptional regulator with PAS, ATPase and Fis domain